MTNRTLITHTATDATGKVHGTTSKREITHVVFLEVTPGNWSPIIWVKSLERAKKELFGRKHAVEIRKVVGQLA